MNYWDKCLNKNTQTSDSNKCGTYVPKKIVLNLYARM